MKDIHREGLHSAAPSEEDRGMDRREAILRLGTLALVASPITTTLLMGSKANAQSVPPPPPCVPPNCP